MRYGSRLATMACTLLCAFAASAWAQAPAPTSPAVTPVCANCHEDKHTSIALTAHGYKNDAGGAMCQACHGDASDHLKDPMKARPANLIARGTQAEKTAVCMTCHAGNRHLAFWESGKHAKNEVPCSTCHNIHGGSQNDPTAVAINQKNPTVTPFTTSSRQSEAQMCGQCHQQIRSAILKPSHHPITEGKVTCSNCHNPHGALSHAMVKQETVNQQCTSCHADKRGPFVFAHPVVEENCLTCHNPHGSSHNMLLNEPAPNLCQDCHDVARHPGTPYGGGASWRKPDGSFNTAVNTRFIARACLNCHNAIHGSNAPANRGQFLIR